MYSGQGSQYYGMAKKLYENNEVFRQWMSYLDKTVVAVGGYSIIEELYCSQKTMSDSFQAIQYTHPAIFMVEYSLTCMLLSLGIEPDYLIGSSLGEIVSLTVAGCETPEKMMEFVVKQALLFKEQCVAGGMITILDDYKDYLDGPILGSDVELVSVNYDKHFVLSGEEAGINRIERNLRKNEIGYLKLPVEYGFHSKSLDAVYCDFMGLTAKLNSVKTKTPVYSCAVAGMIDGFTGDTLWRIVRNSIEFNQTLKKVACSKDIIFIDLGPSGTLASFSKVILNRSDDISSIISPFHKEEQNVMNIKNMLGMLA